MDAQAVGEPVAVTFGKRLYVFFRSDTGRIWYISKNTVAWTASKRVPGTTRTLDAPAAVVFQDTLNSSSVGPPTRSTGTASTGPRGPAGR